MKPYTVEGNPSAQVEEDEEQRCAACASTTTIGNLDTVEESSSELEEKNGQVQAEEERGVRGVRGEETSMHTEGEGVRLGDVHVHEATTRTTGDPACVEDDAFIYHLIGVVIHSGTHANAGHYYSFLKDRRFLFLLSPSFYSSFFPSRLVRN